MAQAVFEDHPLADYLRDAGELGDLMPGTSSELETEIDPFRTAFPNDEEDDSETIAEWRPRLLIELLDILYAFLELIQPPKSPNPFAERFKYDIISSSLLSPTLQTPYHRSTRTPPIPGNLHSRNSSLDTSSSSPPLPPPHATPEEPNYTTSSILAIATAFFYLADHTFFALISLVAVAFSLRSLYIMNDSSKIDMTPCLTSLNELIAASDAWASIIQEAIANIEVEEQSLLYGATFRSASPTSSIRVSLHSSLLTTQNQCDNVRQLFSALTSTTELSQLSEMYAPTPNKSNQALLDPNSRPLSLPTSRSRSRLPDQRRLTWNGSYTSLADQVGPLPPFLRRREKRRSDMTSLLQGVMPGTSRSAPVTPASNSPNGSISSKLASVREETSPNTDSFGATALALQRNLKAGAAEVFGTPPPKTQNRRSWMPSTIASTSRLSSIQSPRHPLSLPTLQNVIQSALASKRYACSHLLALRFSEDEDEAYWEDIRSVMGLLTTTFSDASSRLLQALEDYGKCKAPEISPTLSSGQDDSTRGLCQDVTLQVPRKISESFSFAPMPGPFSRFAEHVAAISSALDNAKEHMESCVTLLNDGHDADARGSNISIQIEDLHGEHPALQAYERLRRELGLTLRECERGRERLLEIVKPPRADPTAHDSDSDDVPTLGHDTSDYSDKPGPRSLSDGEEDDMVMDRVSIAAFLEGKINDGELGYEKDDAAENLLLSASTHHLPPILGIEQVFEAETVTMGGFAKERSKMSREERIKLVKARREKTVTGRHRDYLSDGREDVDGDNEGGEKWGPGGEVVQELKDVIWKVGERRRKFANELHRQSVDVSTPVQTPVDAHNDTLPSLLDGDAKGSLGTKVGS